VVRLPFLLKGDVFFNSDEAVEGLMARHLAELPVFFWGQGYKGVPEVYLAGAVFALFGVGVLQLKAVTLALWAGAVVTLVRLAYAWHGGLVATIAAALIIVGTPSMVAWSLSANAEVVVLSGLVALMLLACRPAPDSPSRPLPLGVFLLAGVSLWIHPVATCAIVALAVVVVLGSTWSARRWPTVRDLILARDATGMLRGTIIVLHVAIAVVALMFLYTFVGGTVSLGPISASHPQRSLRPLGLLAFLALVGHAFTGAFVSRQRAGAALGAFLLGLSPVIFHAARGGGVGTSVVTRYLSDVPWLSIGVVRTILPAFVGLTDADGGPLGLPWWFALPFVTAAAISVVQALGSVRTAPHLLYPTLAIAGVLGLLVVGGAFGGGPSSRYLMPFFGIVAIAAAAGIARLARGNRLAALAIASVCVASFAGSQYLWYQRLSADPSAAMVVGCLEEHGIRFASADYWIAYRLTFIANERVIVAPDPEQDRYTPYRRAVEAASPAVRIDWADRARAAETPAPGSASATVVCASPSLTATLVASGSGR
jgi:hypothetical protein